MLVDKKTGEREQQTFRSERGKVVRSCEVESWRVGVEKMIDD